MGAAAPTAVLTYQTEPLSDSLWSELLPLLERHSAEVTHWSDLPRVIDRQGYDRLASVIRVYTARDDGALIGYLAVVVVPSLQHAGVLVAQSDAFYVSPDHRGHHFARELLLVAARALRAEGVRVFSIGTRHRDDLDVGPLLHRMGYEHIDDIWSCRLDLE